MDVRNCPRCGKMFTFMSHNLCPSCLKKEEESFEALKQYIYDNPNCTLAELSDATDISPKRIMRYVKEGRLEISKGMHGQLTCESCGKPITRGRYCDSCVIRINQEVAGMFKGGNIENKNAGAKMHTTPRKI